MKLPINIRLQAAAASTNAAQGHPSTAGSGYVEEFAGQLHRFDEDFPSYKLVTIVENNKDSTFDVKDSKGAKKTRVRAIQQDAADLWQPKMVVVMGHYYRDRREPLLVSLAGAKIGPEALRGLWLQSEASPALSRLAPEFSSIFRPDSTALSSVVVALYKANDDFSPQLGDIAYDVQVLGLVLYTVDDVLTEGILYLRRPRIDGTEQGQLIMLAHQAGLKDGFHKPEMQVLQSDINWDTLPDPFCAFGFMHVTLDGTRVMFGPPLKAGSVDLAKRVWAWLPDGDSPKTTDLPFLGAGCCVARDMVIKGAHASLYFYVTDASSSEVTAENFSTTGMQDLDKADFDGTAFSRPGDPTSQVAPDPAGHGVPATYGVDLRLYDRRIRGLQRDRSGAYAEVWARTPAIDGMQVVFPMQLAASLAGYTGRAPYLMADNKDTSDGTGDLVAIFTSAAKCLDLSESPSDSFLEQNWQVSLIPGEINPDGRYRYLRYPQKTFRQLGVKVELLKAQLGDLVAEWSQTYFPLTDIELAAKDNPALAAYLATFQTPGIDGLPNWLHDFADTDLGVVEIGHDIPLGLTLGLRGQSIAWEYAGLATHQMLSDDGTISVANSLRGIYSFGITGGLRGVSAPDYACYRSRFTLLPKADAMSDTQDIYGQFVFEPQGSILFGGEVATRLLVPPGAGNGTSGIGLWQITHTDVSYDVIDGGVQNLLVTGTGKYWMWPDVLEMPQTRLIRLVRSGATLTEAYDLDLTLWDRADDGSGARRSLSTRYWQMVACTDRDPSVSRDLLVVVRDWNDPTGDVELSSCAADASATRATAARTQPIPVFEVRALSDGSVGRTFALQPDERFDSDTVVGTTHFTAGSYKYEFHPRLPAKGGITQEMADSGPVQVPWLEVAGTLVDLVAQAGATEDSPYTPGVRNCILILRPGTADDWELIVQSFSADDSRIPDPTSMAIRADGHAVWSGVLQIVTDEAAP